MQEHKDTVDVLRAGYRLLYSLTFHGSNKDILMHCDKGLETIICGMDAHRGDSDVLQRGFRILWNVCALNDQNKTTVGKTRGVEVIITGMIANRKNCELQCQACGVLLSLVHGNELNQNAVREQRGIVAVVCAVRQHNECLERCLTVRNGCCALWNFAYKNQENKVAICRLKGAEAVVDAMNKRASDVAVQHYGCGLFHELVYEGMNMDVIGHQQCCGICLAVVAAMGTHATYENLQYLGCCVLKGLAADKQHNAFLGSHGAVQVVCTAMSMHKDNIPLQHNGCEALGLLGLNQQNSEAIRQSGAIGHVIHAMHTHETHEYIQLAGCAALNAFGDDDDCKVEVRGHGGIEVLLSAMRKHSVCMLYTFKSLPDRRCGHLVSNQAWGHQANSCDYERAQEP
jgi:hypothetical protein